MALATLFLTAYAAAPQCATFTTPNADLPGNDIAQKADISLEECAELCCGHPYCLSVVHLTHDVPHWGDCVNATRCCFLKSVDTGSARAGGEHHTVVNIVKLKDTLIITLNADLGPNISPIDLSMGLRKAANVPESVRIETRSYVTATTRQITFEMVGPSFLVELAYVSLVDQRSNSSSALPQLFPSLLSMQLSSMELTKPMSDRKSEECEMYRRHAGFVVFGSIAIVVILLVGVIMLSCSRRSQKAPPGQVPSVQNAEPVAAPRDMELGARAPPAPAAGPGTDTGADV